MLNVPIKQINKAKNESLFDKIALQPNLEGYSAFSFFD
jgi:hypothetical protein